jgi:hypothetical protein
MKPQEQLALIHEGILYWLLHMLNAHPVWKNLCQVSVYPFAGNQIWVHRYAHFYNTHHIISIQPNATRINKDTICIVILI